MLHLIRLPTYNQDLERILQFQQQFIVFLCSIKTPCYPKETDFEPAFKSEVAQWFYKWLQKKHKNNPSYYQLLCQLLDHISKHPNLRTEIIEAFEHDIDFTNHVADRMFSFSFRKLDSDTQRLLKLLLVPFYDDLLYTGFNAAIASFDRKQFLKIFWNINGQLKVCPACDGAGIDINSNDIRCHIDHFFPKARYPFLAVYAKNLVPICANCNSSYKGEKDPLVHTYANPLIHTFHPFEKPALGEIKIIIERGPKGEKSVHIEEKNGGKSKRIERLNHLFALETRWQGRLNAEIDKVVSKIKNYARRHGQDHASKREIVTTVLRDLEDDADLLGIEHSYVLRHSYVLYALSNNDEFEDLVSLLP